jgi:hypothetical protein
MHLFVAVSPFLFIIHILLAPLLAPSWYSCRRQTRRGRELVWNATIKDLLMTKAAMTTAYCSACIYKLKCLHCQKAYVSQTGRQLTVRYKEHTYSIRLNRDHSKFALHILRNRHSCRSMEQTVIKIDRVEKGWVVNMQENLHVYLLDSWGSVSGRGKRFLSISQHLDWVWPPPSLLSSGCWESFLRVKWSGA